MAAVLWCEIPRGHHSLVADIQGGEGAMAGRDLVPQHGTRLPTMYVMSRPTDHIRVD